MLVDDASIAERPVPGEGQMEGGERMSARGTVATACNDHLTRTTPNNDTSIVFIYQYYCGVPSQAQSTRINSCSNQQSHPETILTSARPSSSGVGHLALEGTSAQEPTPYPKPQNMIDL